MVHILAVFLIIIGITLFVLELSALLGLYIIRNIIVDDLDFLYVINMIFLSIAIALLGWILL